MNVIKVDLEILSYLALHLEENVPEMALFKPTKVVEDFADSLLKELDFHNEAANMLAFGRQHPGQRDWYAAWIIDRKDGTPVGDLCFKGLSAEGIAEIGYGIDEAWQGRGYATEAVQGALRWAFRHPEVAAVEAETDPDNAASQRVLEKCGFQPNGTVGEEGPRYSLPRERAVDFINEV